MNMTTIELSKQIRINVLRMTHNAKASHVGSCLSIADIVGVLYGASLNLRPEEPNWTERDRFILSKGHAGAAIYAALALKGFMPLERLETYGHDESQLMAHISHKIPGVEFSTGSLGHGLPFATGKALAAKNQGSKWKVFALLSDGELDEGSNWESFMFAAHHALDNLIAIIDYNKLQSLATVAKTLGLEPLEKKLHSFGWAVKQVDGNNHDQLNLALSSLPWEAGKPCVLIAHTVKGKGVSFMENKVEWHYRSPNKEQLAAAIAELELNHA
ncbi:transketolase [Limnohabitans sp. JirII-31]|uniref:transketolase n=1 Tax=Limnohabitans sp. JirII-31 TaxID=1977908 RepID=UPI000C1E82A1|nr:transketolase [Limnohabitans sp. JirII-31]PIT74715.1 transketolase [Limnohabitans sp. JirII-31]